VAQPGLSGKGERFAILTHQPAGLRGRREANIIAGMERPITRSLLATFIEYAARDCITPIEWSRFMITHYKDERMEAARCDCVRILQSAPPGKLASADIDRLYDVARDLRESDGR